MVLPVGHKQDPPMHVLPLVWQVIPMHSMSLQSVAPSQSSSRPLVQELSVLAQPAPVPVPVPVPAVPQLPTSPAWIGAPLSSMQIRPAPEQKAYSLSQYAMSFGEAQCARIPAEAATQLPCIVEPAQSK